MTSELREIVEGLDVGQMERRYLLERWLDQVEWMGQKASQAQRRYYALRLTTMIGAVAVPALASGTALGGDLARTSKIAIWVVGLIVAASAAVEQLFHYGDRWHHYRQTAERLRAQGWLFFELAAPYSANGRTHAAAFPAFMRDVEQTLQGDVEAYVTNVTAETGGGRAGASG